MRVLWVLAMTLLLALGTATAQEQEPVAEPSQPEKQEKSDEITFEGVYTYSPKSYRDPFVSPFDLEQLKGEGRKRPGIQGMSINEIVLQGVIKSKRGYEAFVMGSDNKLYWIKAGDELYDGKVLSIGFGENPETGRQEGVIVFRQEVDDPNQLKPYRDITKYTNK